MEIGYIPGKGSGIETNKTQGWEQDLQQTFGAENVTIFKSPGRGYSVIKHFSEVCNQVRELFRQIDHEFFIIAHSAGGLIARKVAVDFGDQIVGVITLATPHQTSGLTACRRLIMPEKRYFHPKKVPKYISQDWGVPAFNKKNKIPSFHQPHWTYGGGRDIRVLDQQSCTKESAQLGRHTSIPLATHGSFYKDPMVRERVIRHVEGVI